MSLLLIYLIGVIYKLIKLNDTITKGDDLIKLSCAIEIVFWPLSIIVACFKEENKYKVVLTFNFIFIIIVAIYAYYWFYISLYKIMPITPCFACIGIILSLITIITLISYIIAIINKKV